MGQSHTRRHISEKLGFVFSPSHPQHDRRSDGGVTRFASPKATLRIIAIVTLAGLFATSGATETKAVVEWVRASAIRLETPVAGHGFADMQPLKKVVGDARIVALGEATHGTREFFQLKHRMLEFLATEMGFTIFSIEANMPEAYRLNDFVLHGKGDPAALLRGMGFSVWDTQEVLDMIVWMREFNKSGNGRLQFTGFDMQSPDLALETVGNFVAGAEPAYRDSLRQATDLARRTSADLSRAAFGVVGAILPVRAAAGKRICLAGYIKTEAVTEGYAGLWLRVDGRSGPLASENMQNRGASGTTDWRRFEIELPVAAEARHINFGGIFTGNGTAWFDGLTIELDGTPYADKNAFDLDFESASLTGFYPWSSSGYQVQLDSRVFLGGRQSLRMTRFSGATDTKGVDPKLASSTWKDVVRHLETSREAYRKQGAGSRDIEWAIQNARIVQQSMQKRANEATRDKSMADNVKWILDNNPGAKIVLWAHNAHVSVAGIRAPLAGVQFAPMGASLREMFSTEMVVFGFAFNQGSFQAVEPGTGLRDFTVPPSPEGTLEAMFASTGIPLFALDLRTAPKNGPVSVWLKEPHETRSVGAGFSDTPIARSLPELTAPHCFDAMFFVEKTTAARKNR